ncbi:hypothetical protein [Clostridium lacusfryxellense]|uniref:hypothetical protein n=1 Tax=Clostridium lacusfryxellense TaxID=205328 RepID=UPI001C0C57C2|nr:hypothetical protein [Clostridium lacusfryxellense]MBU3111024.1 hypothetical protein [Clostridium lacusfryxellense]
MKYSEEELNYIMSRILVIESMLNKMNSFISSITIKFKFNFKLLVAEGHTNLNITKEGEDVNAGIG